MNAVSQGSLHRDLPREPLPEEVVTILLERPSLRIKRIVSTGQSTPEDRWYDQETDEWVLLVAGAARLRIEGEGRERELAEGRLALPAGALPPPGDLDAGRAADDLARLAFSAWGAALRTLPVPTDSG